MTVYVIKILIEGNRNACKVKVFKDLDELKETVKKLIDEYVETYAGFVTKIDENHYKVQAINLMISIYIEEHSI